MENLFGKLQEACRKANAQEIENLLQETQVQYPKEYREAKEKVSEYLIFANCPKEAKERIEKEILTENFAFKPVDIPHDWLIYNTNDLYETSTGWYRKAFSYQKKEGIRTFIRFDGVYMDRW